MGKIKDAFKSAEDAVMSNDTVSELVDDWKTGVDVIRDSVTERFVHSRTSESGSAHNGVAEDTSSAVANGIANFGEAAAAAIDTGSGIDAVNVPSQRTDRPASPPIHSNGSVGASSAVDMPDSHAASGNAVSSSHGTVSRSSVNEGMNDKIFRKTMATGTLAAKLAQHDGMSPVDAYDVGNAVAAYTSQLTMFNATCKGAELSEATRNLADRVSRQYGVDAAVIKDSYDESTKLLRQAGSPINMVNEPSEYVNLAISAVDETRAFMRDNKDLVKADSISVSEMGYHNAADVTSQVISQVTGYEPEAANADYDADVAD